ncbi:MAG: hypothetical protein BWY80_00096 [Firmicutes bacterium ADurb.Bin456]|nr:MAG: hypothetical protein BWY80_00096 [Firmicutes bacterium ADurb.Bin456]
MKLKRKALSILVTLSFLVCMLVPMAAPAGAATGYSVLSAPNVDDNDVWALGTVFSQVTAGGLEQGDTMTFRLPGDFVWSKAGTKDTRMTNWSGEVLANGDVRYGEKNGNYILLPKYYAGDENGLVTEGWGAGMLEFTMISDKEVKVEIKGEPQSGQDCFFYIYPKNIFVADGFDGAIEMIFDSPGGSGFADGSVTVGYVSGGKVTVSVSSVDSFSERDSVTFRITEDTAGAYEKKDESLKLRLPSGFVWGNSFNDMKTIWGDKNLETALRAGALKIDGDELIFNLANYAGSKDAVSLELKIDIVVDDETSAKTGDIIAKISGKSDLTPSELKVGVYGTYDAEIKVVGDVPTVYAGQLEQVIADIAINEAVADSIVKGRTLTLELPENARWGDVDDDSHKGLSINLSSFPGTDGKTAKFEFSGVSKEAAKLKLGEMEVVLEAGVTGDLVVKVGGTAGLSGELTVAKIIAPVTAEAAAVPEVRIGSVNPAGDITIIEGKAEAIKKNKWITLDLPAGVRFANKPKVEVIEGDVSIDVGSVKLAKDGDQDDNSALFYVKGDSSVASKIKVSNINYIVDRTVPEGDIKISVKGDSLVEVNDANEVNKYYSFDGNMIKIDGIKAFSLDSDHKVFPRTGSAAKVANAKVVTPADSSYSSNAVFVIGDTNYTVNGVQMTADVAPYLKNDRTYLPVRYVATALGVADANIMWNEAEQSVVIIKGDRVIKLVIGSTNMMINGVPFGMDVAPEIVDPGRTMLPLRWVAQALGADVQWDAATQTVTIDTL